MFPKKIVIVHYYNHWGKKILWALCCIEHSMAYGTQWPWHSMALGTQWPWAVNNPWALNGLGHWGTWSPVHLVAWALTGPIGHFLWEEMKFAMYQGIRLWHRGKYEILLDIVG
jgi:hypothetical protein